MRHSRIDGVMKRVPERWLAALRSAIVLGALTLPFAVATHVVGEFAALGWERGLPVVFGSGHTYFAWLAIGIFGLLARTAVTRGARTRRACVAQLVASLPMRGSGVRFAALCAAIQLGFFAITQLLEGAPMDSGDLRLGLAVALVTALAGSLAIVAVKRLMLGFVAGILLIWLTAGSGPRPHARALARPAGTTRLRWAILASRASRPPPARLSPA